ncbi:Swt1 family HEPN domain-containing protein [Methylobacterium symbioticum]|uniref:Swt1 family HEPN domain-containing protein n=1 Tax=Methylobacterium symbioticum TaxID=2584084 RepID=UPI001158BD44|nr:Swt1 family HEPN domain-containing protein [Methylobacterium symbioticum]
MIKVVELFTLKNSAISSEIRDILKEHSFSNQRGAVEIATDKLVEEHLKQVDERIRRNADRMSEFYKMFYVLENDIRDLVQDTLETSSGSAWWENLTPQNVKENARKNRDRESNEGLAPRSSRIIDYTTFGELGEIISANWDIFSGVFGGVDKNRVLRVINRLNLVRGPIAHCGLLDEEEIVRLKLTIRDWYKLAS